MLSGTLNDAWTSDMGSNPGTGAIAAPCLAERTCRKLSVGRFELWVCPKELRPVPKVLASSQKRGNQDRPHAKSQAPSDHQKILGMRLVLIIQTYGLALLKALGINHNTPWLHPARDFPAMPRGKAAALLPQTEVMGSPAICPKL